MNHATYYLLDVFTDQKYGGNPLAIFPDATSIDSGLFQKIAKELNLSETVFLFPPQQKGKPYSMRIFTPAKELPTAGHPTIGTAYYLSREIDHGISQQEKITLQQKIGLIDVIVDFKDNLPDLITMHQPLPEFGTLHDNRKEFAEMLSLDEADLDDLPIQEVSCGNNNLIIPIKSAKVLGKIQLRIDKWENLKDTFNNAAIYVFSIHDVIEGDVQGRMFGPGVGIMEDPATGSANGPLACYLSKHNILKMPALSLQGYEMGRPSQLHLDIGHDDQGNINLVKVGGKCVYIGKGTLFLDFD